MRIECECVSDLDLVMLLKDTFMCNKMSQFARVKCIYRQDSLYAIIRVKYSFSRMSIRTDARCHLDHSHTLLGIDHSEVLVYLWQSTGVSLC